MSHLEVSREVVELRPNQHFLISRGFRLKAAASRGFAGG